MSQAQVVLIGAGHAHLHVAANAQRLVHAGADVTLIEPCDFWYSGMAAGTLGGQYGADAGVINAEALITQRGGRFIRGRVVGIDRPAQQLQLDNGQTVNYDWLSLNVGSVSQIPASIADLPNLVPVKPLAGLVQLRQSILQNNRQSRKIAVIGSGATGVEISANLRALQPNLSIDLFSQSQRLLSAYKPAIGQAAAEYLQHNGINLMLNASPSHEELFAYDHVVAATGLQPSPLMAYLTGQSNQTAVVHESLQLLDDPKVFAVGDSASIKGYPRPRLGVFGVKAAPVLLHNLLAMLKGEKLNNYQPQQRWLSIINLGYPQALLVWGNETQQPIWWLGRTSGTIKHFLDQRFVAKYR